MVVKFSIMPEKQSVIESILNCCTCLLDIEKDSKCFRAGMMPRDSSNDHAWTTAITSLVTVIGTFVRSGVENEVG